MTKPITFTATVGAWLPSPECYSAAEIFRMIEEGDQSEAIQRLHFVVNDMSQGSYPWLKVGEAEVTVTLFSPDALASKEIKALQTQLQTERAQSQRRQNAILDRISKLSALTMTADAG